MNLLAKHHHLTAQRSAKLGGGETGSHPLETGSLSDTHRRRDLVHRLQDAWDRTRALPPDPQLSLLGSDGPC